VTPNPPVMMVAPSGIGFKIGSMSLVILFIISLVPFHP
ncbi:putative membrane protein, partial [Acinetobacter baumannii 342950]